MKEMKSKQGVILRSRSCLNRQFGAFMVWKLDSLFKRKIATEWKKRLMLHMLACTLEKMVFKKNSLSSKE